MPMNGTSDLLPAPSADPILDSNSLFQKRRSAFRPFVRVLKGGMVKAATGQTSALRVAVPEEVRGDLARGHQLVLRLCLPSGEHVPWSRYEVTLTAGGHESVDRVPRLVRIQVERRPKTRHNLRWRNVYHEGIDVTPLLLRSRARVDLTAARTADDFFPFFSCKLAIPHAPAKPPYNPLANAPNNPDEFSYKEMPAASLVLEQVAVRDIESLVREVQQRDAVETQRDDTVRQIRQEKLSSLRKKLDETRNWIERVETQQEKRCCCGRVENLQRCSRCKSAWYI
ncbi:MAG: hypothetical protein MHM6MM_008408 [Cercozoa sp. M6MM]